MPVAHKQGADRSGSGDSRPPRVFGAFLRVEKGTAPPRAVAAKEKLDEIIIKCDNRKSGAFLWEKVIFIRAAGGV